MSFSPWCSSSKMFYNFAPRTLDISEDQARIHNLLWSCWWAKISNSSSAPKRAFIFLNQMSLYFCIKMSSYFCIKMSSYFCTKMSSYFCTKCRFGLRRMFLPEDLNLSRKSLGEKQSVKHFQQYWMNTCTAERRDVLGPTVGQWPEISRVGGCEIKRHFSFFEDLLVEDY